MTENAEPRTDPPAPDDGSDREPYVPDEYYPDRDADEERGVFAKLADDVEAGRLNPKDAVIRLFRGLAAQESGVDPTDAFYPDEAEDNAGA